MLFAPEDQVCGVPAAVTREAVQPGKIAEVGTRTEVLGDGRRHDAARAAFARDAELIA